MKTCTKCNIEKPFEAFCKNKHSKDGHTEWCKECQKVRREELKKSPLMQLEKQIRSSILLENKLLAREGKKLCTKCKDIFLIDDIIGGKYCKNCNRKRNKKYIEKNKGKLKEKQKEWIEKNKDKKKEQQRQYRLKNKDELKEYQKEYRLKKKLEKENRTTS